jgi:hypothetical protein
VPAWAVEQGAARAANAIHGVAFLSRDRGDWFFEPAEERCMGERLGLAGKIRGGDAEGGAAVF